MRMISLPAQIRMAPNGVKSFQVESARALPMEKPKNGMLMGLKNHPQFTAMIKKDLI